MIQEKEMKSLHIFDKNNRHKKCVQFLRETILANDFNNEKAPIRKPFVFFLKTVDAVIFDFEGN